VGVTTAGGLEFAHGALLVKRNYVFVPAPDYWRAKEERKVLAKTLGLSEKQVFPLRFTLRVPIRGEKEARTGVFT
jgi:hypothetical protein